MDCRQILNTARTLCRDSGSELLFLTCFGSRLYGTENPGSSDLDVRGIFLPSLASVVLGQAPKSLHFSTGTAEARNSAGDMDMDLWSIQHWLLTLLSAGDIGAVDLLFSPSHAACTLYRDARLDDIFSQTSRLVDSRNGRAYTEYCLGQARKYGMKGTRLGALRAVHEWLKKHAPDPRLRLAGILPDLLRDCGDGRHCVAVADESDLRLCGKVYQGSVRLAELCRRVALEMEQHGQSVLDAQKGKGLDFKALSHALRALDQMEELIGTGRIVFPLKTREILIAVKRGLFSWQELEERILHRLEEVDRLRRASPAAAVYDRTFAESRVLACYGLKR